MVGWVCTVCAMIKKEAGVKVRRRTMGISSSGSGPGELSVIRSP